jgi:hypothetical protein
MTNTMLEQPGKSRYCTKNKAYYNYQQWNKDKSSQEVEWHFIPFIFNKVKSQGSIKSDHKGKD